MRRLFICSLVAAAAACAPRVGVSPQETASPDAPDTAVPAELVSVRPAYITAWSGSDPAALRVYFGDDAIVVTPSGTYTGWSDINTRWVVPMLPQHYMMTPTHFTKTGDHTIVETGSYTYTMDHNGSPMAMKGSYSYKWKKQPDGSWRIASVDIK